MTSTKPQYTSRRTRSGITNCTGCRRKFTPVECFAIVEEKTNWCRGDDIVCAFCRECCIAKGLPEPPQPKFKKDECVHCGSWHKTAQGMEAHMQAKHAGQGQDAEGAV